MNKFYIIINENESGNYDFFIELSNDELKLDRKRIAEKKDIPQLLLCCEMIEDFPLSNNAKLYIEFNRIDKFKTPNLKESYFDTFMKNLLTTNDIDGYKFN